MKRDDSRCLNGAGWLFHQTDNKRNAASAFPAGDIARRHDMSARWSPTMISARNYRHDRPGAMTEDLCLSITRRSSSAIDFGRMRRGSRVSPIVGIDILLSFASRADVDGIGFISQCARVLLRCHRYAGSPARIIDGRQGAPARGMRRWKLRQRFLRPRRYPATNSMPRRVGRRIDMPAHPLTAAFGAATSYQRSGLELGLLAQARQGTHERPR